MEKATNLSKAMSRIVNSHLLIMVKDTLDVLQVQVEKDHGVPQKLIQKEITKRIIGPDVINTAI